MGNYMKEYRQGRLRRGIPEGSIQHKRREKLKEDHRFYSFKWRLSKLLSRQYEILLFLQYEPEYDQTDDDQFIGYSDEFCNNINEVLLCFRILDFEFQCACDMGGSELFKAFLFRKYSRKWNWSVDCVVGVLDKAALLENLQRLPDQGGQRWGAVLNKVKIEAGKGGWHKLDFSGGSAIWVEAYTECYLLKWTKRSRPRWSSSELHSLLSRWVQGSRKLGIREPLNNNSRTKMMISPILWGNKIA
jgi:hypothetical protein